MEKFATFDPQSSLTALATVQNATNAEQNSVLGAAEAARTGQQMIALKSGDIKAALSALAEIDDGNNKILDINSSVVEANVTPDDYALQLALVCRELRRVVYRVTSQSYLGDGFGPQSVVLMLEIDRMGRAFVVDRIETRNPCIEEL